MGDADACRRARMKTTPAGIKRVAPAAYLADRGALRHLRAIVAGVGNAPLLVHGSNGASAVERSKPGVLPAWARYLHEGVCSQRAIDAAVEAIGAPAADVVVALGGGRVIDVGKAAADHADVPVVTVPTSAATCAAMTALAVSYDEAGRWSGGRPLSRAPDAVVIDLDVVRAAPRRLLAAGVLDATAKTHEVRLALRRSRGPLPTASAALALCDQLDATIRTCVPAVYGGEEVPTGSEALDVLAEAVIAFPGWIGGLAGESNKVAVAHAVHNALTLIPGSKRSLHGELVGFGVVVQTLLEGRSTATVTDLIALLGAPRTLAQLGCSSFSDTPAACAEVLARVLEAPATRAAFPALEPDALRGAMLRAEEPAGAAGSR